MMFVVEIHLFRLVLKEIFEKLWGGGLGGSFFPRCVFFWKVGGNIPPNSYEDLHGSIRFLTG